MKIKWFNTKMYPLFTKMKYFLKINLKDWGCSSVVEHSSSNVQAWFGFPELKQNKKRSEEEREGEGKGGKGRLPNYKCFILWTHFKYFLAIKSYPLFSIYKSTCLRFPTQNPTPHWHLPPRSHLVRIRLGMPRSFKQPCLSSSRNLRGN